MPPQPASVTAIASVTNAAERFDLTSTQTVPFRATGRSGSMRQFVL
jgi:hypothetical protein